MPAPRPILDRLLEKREIAGECWLWTGATNNKGYGQIHRSGETALVHRVAYELLKGETPPADMNVLHSCDTPRCFNPEHLRIGTQAENILDIKRSGKKTGAAGSAHGKAKLSLAQVEYIRSLPNRPGLTKELAARFGMSRRSIWVIRSGRGWKEERSGSRRHPDF